MLSTEPAQLVQYVNMLFFGHACEYFVEDFVWWNCDLLEISVGAFRVRCVIYVRQYQHFHEIYDDKY